MCFFYIELEVTSGKGDQRGREFGRAGRGRGERGADGPAGSLCGHGWRWTVRARQGHGRAELRRTAWSRSTASFKRHQWRLQWGEDVGEWGRGGDGGFRRVVRRGRGVGRPGVARSAGARRRGREQSWWRRRRRGGRRMGEGPRVGLAGQWERGGGWWRGGLGLMGQIGRLGFLGFLFFLFYFLLKI
jgi:hypothetical protein